MQIREAVTLLLEVNQAYVKILGRRHMAEKVRRSKTQAEDKLSMKFVPISPFPKAR